MIERACGVLLGVVLFPTVYALEATRVEALYQDKEFQVTLELVLDAPAARIEEVLRDYAAYPQLDAGILASQVRARPDAHSVVLFTKLRACSGPFCRTVQRVERVVESPMELRAEAIPAESDVLLGITETRLQPQGNRTLVSYRTRLTPKFWVPGLIGRPLMLRTLRESSLNLFRSIEARAKAAM